ALGQRRVTHRRGEPISGPVASRADRLVQLYFQHGVRRQLDELLPVAGRHRGGHGDEEQGDGSPGETVFHPTTSFGAPTATPDPSRSKALDATLWPRMVDAQRFSS